MGGGRIIARATSCAPTHRPSLDSAGHRSPRMTDTPDAPRRVFRSPLPSLDIPDLPLSALVLNKAGSMPDAVAFVDGTTGVATTFAALSDAVHRLAGGLAQAGVGPGTCVALMAPTCPEFAIVFHAVATRGASVTTVNPTYTAHELRHQLEDAGATLLVTVPAILDVAKAGSDGTRVAEIVTIGSESGHRSIDDLMSDPIEQVPVDVADAVVALPYSSGTTGLPKGVMLTHANLVANVCQLNAILPVEAGEAGLAVLPFFHIFGMEAAMNAWLAAGVTVVTLPRFDMGRALSLIEEHRVAHLYAVPPIVLGLAKSPLVDAHDLSSLRRIVCGAAPLGADLTREAATRVGCPIVQAYGMTELSPLSHANPPAGDVPGSSGVAAPDTESRVVDPDGNDLGVDEVGELLVRGPQVMKGYLNNSAATAACLDDEGWLATGDVVRIDADGYVFIVDRAKELIKVLGFQVAPAELEALIVTHPDVADVAVIGVPDDEAGERPKAFVVVKEDGEVDADAVRAFVAERAATYKHLHEVEFVEAIPKSASGKILRRVLREA